MLLTNIAFAAEVAEQTAEGAAEVGLPASLGINGTLFVFQLINFAIVVIVLWFLILKPLTKKMSERQKMIEDSIENAKKIETNLGMSERKYQERIDQAKADANIFIEKAQLEAVVVAEAMKEKTKKEIEQLVEQARKNIKTERDESIGELKAQAVNLIISAAEKILYTKLDIKNDDKIIEEAVESLK